MPLSERRAETLPAVILAGGLSRRMGGQEKALLPLGGRTLVEHAARRIATMCAPVAINANGDASRFATIGLPVIPDTVPETPGPLAGVLAAMRFAEGIGAQSVITLPADTPFFPDDLVTHLLANRGAHGLAVAAGKDRDGGIRTHPVFGLWPVILAEALEAALMDGIRKVETFTAAHAAGLAVFGTAAVDPFFNINTPDDLARAEAMIGANPALFDDVSR